MQLSKLWVAVLEMVALILIYNIVYISILYLRDTSFKNKIEQGLNRANIENLKRNIQYVSKKRRPKYIENLALLIQQSAVNGRYKFITPWFVIFISCIISIIFFIVSQSTLKIFPSSILIAVIGYKIPAVVLNILVFVNSNKITRKLVDFINLLKNFCMIKNDISFAIKETSSYMKEPIKSACENYTYEVKHGIPPYTALENIKDKVDSTQYSLLIKNLQICSKYSNQYLLVLKKSASLMMRFAKEQTERQKEIKRGVKGVVMIIALSILIWIMLSYMNPDLLSSLQSSSIGNIIMTMICFACTAGVMIIEKLARIEY